MFLPHVMITIPLFCRGGKNTIEILEVSSNCWIRPSYPLCEKEIGIVNITSFTKSPNISSYLSWTESHTTSSVNLWATSLIYIDLVTFRWFNHLNMIISIPSYHAHNIASFTKSNKSECKQGVAIFNAQTKLDSPC